MTARHHLLVLLAVCLGVCVCIVDAQSVKMTWCYGTTTCASSCIYWVAQDGACYPGTNGAPAARVFVNTTRSPPSEGALVSYSTSADCSGAISGYVPLPLDGACHQAGTDSFKASLNNGAHATTALGGGVLAVAVGASLWLALRLA
jgi:hypothetical protein